MPLSLPNRKSIRLKDYDYAQQNAYFVTICTHHRANLFGSIDVSSVGAHPCVRPNSANKMIENWLFKLETKYEGISIDCYVIMPNHLHVILFNTGAHTGAPLPQIVKWFKTQTTNAYIRGVKDGLYPPFDQHVWQRNYYEHIIRNEHDLTDIRRYIEENPLKWQEDTYFHS